MDHTDFVDVINQSMDLHTKAAAIDTMLWEHCRSPEDLLYTFVFPGEWRHVTIDDPASTAPDPAKLSPKDLKYDDEPFVVRQVDGKPQYLMQGIPLEDIESYEDTLMATGSYLSALTFRYMATFDPTARQCAHQVFQALYAVYQLGLQEQRGWIPKPYGFQCTKQTSTDNQCPMSLGLIRYYRIADDKDRAKIKELLIDQMDYWIRNNFAPHLSYFGILETLATLKEAYPGHWPLLYLPLCEAVWKLTSDDKYRQQRDWLISEIDMDATADPDYVTFTVGCQGRWYYQLGAVLELDVPRRYQWLKGIRNTLQSLEMRTWKHQAEFTADMLQHRFIWVTRASEELRTVHHQLLVGRLDDLHYLWPKNYRPDPVLAWRDRCIYTPKAASWLEVYWKGRVYGHFG